MSGQSLKDYAQAGVDWIRRKDPAAQVEIFAGRDRDRGIDLKEGRPESVTESEEEGVGLRLIKDGRMSFAYAGGIEDDSVERLYGRAVEQLPHLEIDEARGLAEPSFEPAGSAALRASLVDPAMFKAPLSSLLPRLKSVHEKTLAMDSRVSKVLNIGYSESFEEAAIATTTGILAYECENYCGFGLALMAGSGREIQVGGGSCTARRSADLDWEAAAGEAVARTTALLKGKKLPSKRTSVLIDPWACGELLDMLSGALSAEEVQRGRSMFKGKLGQRVASSLVTFIDDPLRLGGMSSLPFDDEGVPSRTKTVIERGVLQEYFYDTYTARKDGIASNGCAGRLGYNGTPDPTPSNFYLKPGTMSRQKLIESTKDGILVFEIMGMHTADPVSGEMSVGVSGVAIRNGEIAHGVKGAMLSCSIFDLLERVDAVADDLIFYGGLAAPTFRVADLTIA